MIQLEWATVALQTATRADGSDVIVRWRKHQPIGRIKFSHAVDVRTAGGRCCVFDQRGMHEAQAEYWFDRKLKELSRMGFRTPDSTYSAVGVH